MRGPYELASLPQCFGAKNDIRVELPFSLVAEKSGVYGQNLRPKVHVGTVGGRIVALRYPLGEYFADISPTLYCKLLMHFGGNR